MRQKIFLTILIINIFNVYDKINIYSPSIHQEIYQKLIECFSKFVPINIITTTLIEEDKDVVTDEIFKNKDFQESNIEI